MYILYMLIVLSGQPEEFYSRPIYSNVDSCAIAGDLLLAGVLYALNKGAVVKAEVICFPEIEV